MLHKLCNQCWEWYPCNLEHFYKNDKNKKDGLYPSCKECDRKRSIQWGRDNWEYKSEYFRNVWYVNNLEEHLGKVHTYKREHRPQYNEYQKKHYEKYPENLKRNNQNRTKKNHKISNKQWINCKNYFDNSCAYCGITYEEHKK